MKTKKNGTLDQISRQAAIDALENEVRLIDGYYIMDDEVINKDDAIEAIRLLPSAQPEIILCKDCTWCQDDTVHGKVFCSREGAMDRIELDSYCSYGERETDG